MILVAKASATSATNSTTLIKTLVNAGVSHTWRATVVGVVAVWVEEFLTESIPNQSKFRHISHPNKNINITPL